jgi:hypothetical protein
MKSTLKQQTMIRGTVRQMSCWHAFGPSGDVGSTA